MTNLGKKNTPEHGVSSLSGREACVRASAHTREGVRSEVLKLGILANIFNLRCADPRTAAWIFGKVKV